LNLQRLSVLRELRDRRTLAAAATALNLSPSAASQHLSQLQVEVGVQLVERRGRVLQLTPAGRALADDCEAIFEALERARAHLTSFKSGRGATIRIAAFQSAASVALPPALSLLADEPNLRLEVYELEPEASLPLLVRGELDLVVGQEYEQAPRTRHPGIAQRTEVHEGVLVALPPDDPLAKHGSSVQLSALADRAWAAGQPTTAYAQTVLAACRTAGFEPDVRYRSNDVTVFLSLVAHGHAVALVPALALAAPSLPSVSPHGVSGLDLRRRIFTAVRRGDDERPVLASVRDAVSASLRAVLAESRRGRPHESGELYDPSCS
jgi:DNA-binding transcriptional LysR family regulator